jgi:hypothetical protein
VLLTRPKIIIIIIIITAILKNFLSKVISSNHNLKIHPVFLFIESILYADFRQCSLLYVLIKPMKKSCDFSCIHSFSGVGDITQGLGHARHILYCCITSRAGSFFTQSLTV